MLILRGVGCVKGCFCLDICQLMVNGWWVLVAYYPRNSL